MPPEIQGREYADHRKDGGGKTDELVVGAMGNDIQQISQRRRDQQTGKTDAIPQDQKKIVQEKTTQQAVAEQMETIGVQGEGGDKSVILPVTKNAT